MEMEAHKSVHATERRRPSFSGSSAAIALWPLPWASQQCPVLCALVQCLPHPHHTPPCCAVAIYLESQPIDHDPSARQDAMLLLYTTCAAVQHAQPKPDDFRQSLSIRGCGMQRADHQAYASGKRCASRSPPSDDLLCSKHSFISPLASESHLTRCISPGNSRAAVTPSLLPLSQYTPPSLLPSLEVGQRTHLLSLRLMLRLHTS